MSSSSKIILGYIPEVVQGTTPASALKNLPFTDASMNVEISTTESSQLSAVRSSLSLVRTEGNINANIGFEGQFGTYRSFWESALGAAMKAGQVLTATDISAANGDNSFNSVAAAFNIAQITPGTVIKVAGFATAANNGLFLVVSATTAKIVVSGGTLVTEAAGASVTVTARDLRDGSDIKSLSLEWNYSDLTTTFSYVKGAVVDTASLSASVGSIVTGSFGLIGLEGDYAAATIGTGANSAQDSNDSWSPVGSIGTIYEDGVALSGVCISSLDINTTNAYRAQKCLGSLYSSATNIGSFGCTGTISAYFNDATLINKFIDGVATSLRWNFVDADGKVFSVFLPNVALNTGSLSGQTKDSDVMVELGYTALYDPTLGFAMQISELA